MTRHAATASKPKSAAMRLVTLVALVAFFLQSFAIQTHVHNIVQGSTGIVGAENIPAPSPINLRDATDAGNCRLCQELSHSGSYFVPAVLTHLTVLGLALLPSAIAQLPIAASVPLFNWQSRAPPRR